MFSYLCNEKTTNKDFTDTKHGINFQTVRYILHVEVNFSTPCIIGQISAFTIRKAKK